MAGMRQNPARHLPLVSHSSQRLFFLKPQSLTSFIQSEFSPRWCFSPQNTTFLIHCEAFFYQHLFVTLSSADFSHWIWLSRCSGYGGVLNSWTWIRKAQVWAGRWYSKGKHILDLTCWSLRAKGRDYLRSCFLFSGSLFSCMNACSVWFLFVLMLNLPWFLSDICWEL